MSYLNKNISRRHFLGKTALMTAGCLLGFNYFSKAFAVQGNNHARPRLAIIIDDIGYSLSRARRFIDLGIPITFSILPRLPDSFKASIEIKNNGHDIMLHQPMEPCNSSLDPGPGALFAGYGKERITKIIEDNISEVPFASGINNHMGSKFTALQDKMHYALSIIKDKKMFFVDSLTSGSSKGFTTARSLNMAAAQRNVFLDNLPVEEAILSQLSKLVKIAHIHGTAIGIGHPFPETASAIKAFCGSPAGHSVSLVHISAVIKC